MGSADFPVLLGSIPHWIRRLHAVRPRNGGLRREAATLATPFPLLLLSVALASSFIPAWRASRVDPAIALRDE
jgi:hypothetical protein